MNMQRISEFLYFDPYYKASMKSRFTVGSNTLNKNKTAFEEQLRERRHKNYLSGLIRQKEVSTTHKVQINFNFSGNYQREIFNSFGSSQASPLNSFESSPKKLLKFGVKSKSISKIIAAPFAVATESRSPKFIQTEESTPVFSKIRHVSSFSGLNKGLSEQIKQARDCEDRENEIKELYMKLSPSKKTHHRKDQSANEYLMFYDDIRQSNLWGKRYADRSQ